MTLIGAYLLVNRILLTQRFSLSLRLSGVEAGIKAALTICMKKMQVKVTKVPKEETTDGKARWDVMVDDKWDSSWDQKQQAKTRIERMLKGEVQDIDANEIEFIK